jgi:hypothetical protein
MAISGGTRKTLWTRARDQCAFPGCLQTLTSTIADPTSGDTRVVVLGEEAHIRAQSAGGPRYDPSYAQDVDGYENLVLLCPTHHTLIDAHGGAGYLVDDLIRMKAEHERVQERHSALQGTLRAYLGDRYAAEDSVQFQQVDLRGPSVDSMFVDVPIGCRRDGSSVAKLLTRIAQAAPGDTRELEEASGLIVTGATQALLHPDWAGHAVLVGGPGQGKSTVLQYVCQFYRAARLGESGYTAGQVGLSRAGTTFRFPIRIDLRKYAQWASTTSSARKKGKDGRKRPVSDDSWRSLEEYVVNDIKRHIGANSFEPRDLAVLFATEPVLLALDGLDEVASLATRARVVAEIALARGRLSPDAADLVILVTTRPGSSVQSLTSSGAFPTLFLQRLTQGLRLQYLQQWVAVSRLSSEAASRLQTTFQESQHVPHIAELASYPMQLAILLHLLHRRQLLPQQRTELYSEYLKTFLDREQTEDKEPLLADQRRVVEDTHAYLGWYLQAKAEQGGTSGSIDRDELRRVLRSYLAGQPEDQQLADDLYSAITDRVLCMVERDDAFEFEVQSLREYFAARFIFDNLAPKGDGNSRDDGVNALLERPYWANVCRFFIGMLSRGEVRALRDNFHTVARRVSPHPMVRTMAALILNDRIYEGLLDQEFSEVVDFILDGPGLVLAQDGALDSVGTPMLLGERAGRRQVVAHAKGRLERAESLPIRRAAARTLAAHASTNDEVASWWWSLFEPTTRWVETAASLRILGGLDPDRARQLASAIKEVASDLEWVTELLVAGGYDGNATDVLAAIRADLNDGAAEVVERAHGRSDFHLLVTRSGSALAGNISPLLAPTTQSSGAPDPAEWEQRLGAISDAWQDGWILRRAVSMSAPTADLVGLADRSPSTATATAATAEASYRSHRNDPSWWQTQLQKSDRGRQLMLTIIAILEHAHSKVVIELGPSLDQAVGNLCPKEFRVVERALQRDVAARRVRPLDLRDALRLARLKPSGRNLWLIWIVGTDGTRERVASRLGPELADVFAAGTADGRQAVAVSATKGARKLKLETFEGARGVLPSGGWADASRLATMSMATARQILERPEVWPADSVQTAIELLTLRTAQRTPPLAEVATGNRWFPVPG